jgi:BolA family transcriptional regulator, general stress-responsive regulator
MTRKQRIEQALQAAFQPSRLVVRDDSHKHAGHNAEAASGGETHFHITIVSEAFAGMSRVAMHRAVQDACREEFDKGLHAFQIDAKAV